MSERERERESVTHTYTLHIKCSNELSIFYIWKSYSSQLLDLVLSQLFISFIAHLNSQRMRSNEMEEPDCALMCDRKSENEKGHTANKRRNTTCTKRINVISAFHEHPLQSKAIHLEICNYSNSAYLHLHAAVQHIANV